MTAPRPTVLSAFSGLGGLDLGLEAAGFRTIGCIEFDEYARSSLRANTKWRMLRPFDIETLAETLQPADLALARGELSLLAGAPPCQPYSKAAMWATNSWNGFSDPRAKPLLSFFDLAERFLPRAVVMENVQGFVTGPNSVLPLIRKRFDLINEIADTSYSVSWQILDAADYGVPQRRRRAIVVAFRDGNAMEWPERTHAETPVRAWDALHNLYPLAVPPKAQGKWADLLPSIPEGENYLFHTANGRGKELFGYRTRYWSFLLKLAKDQPSWTLPAQPGPSVGPFHWDNRPLAVPEALRLQTFPSDWQTLGSRREQIRQVGNATPPLLAEVLGRSIRRVLDEKQWRRPPDYAIVRQEAVPLAEKTRSVPSKYRHLIREYAAHGGTGQGPKPRIQKEALGT